MTDEAMWDYSKIPERKWKWHFEEDHWMELEVDSSGLTYIGTDWTCQSGGGYFGGFQTFEEFLSTRSLQKMPKEIRNEVKEYLLKHRERGGAFLRLLYRHRIDDYQLTGVFVHLDDKPIHVKIVSDMDEMVIFDGSINPGQHQFSFVFIVESKRTKKKISGTFEMVVNDGKNSAVMEIVDDEEGNPLMRFIDDNP